MADLPLNPPTLFLVIGLPGSGKTHFSRQFSEQYELPYISDNRVRYELFEDPSFSRDENQVVSNILDLMFDACLKTGTSVIYEAQLNQSQRQTISKKAKAAGYRILYVWVQIDRATALARSLKKDRRNPDDKYSQAMTNNVFDKFEKLFSAPGAKDASVVISGKFAYKSQLLAVTRKLIHLYGGDTLTAASQTRINPTQHHIQ